ncbi:hypothetical protein V8E54_013475 [Elaphomyces granulatus]
MTTPNGYGPLMQTSVHVPTPGGSHHMHSRPTESTKSTTSKPWPTPSLECYNYQEIPTGGPLGADVANALNKSDQITKECSDFSGSADSKVFHHGFIYILIQRESPRPLVYCNAALTLIIDTCIMWNNTYGGMYSLDGETYIIWNAVYPKNPLT